MRTRSLPAGVVTAAVAVLAAGCGGAGSGTAGAQASTAPSAAATPSATAGAPAPAAGPTKLTVMATAESGTTVTWTLTCDPVGGDHPEAAAACAKLATVEPTVFEPVPADQGCTMIYGGPQTAAVTGTWRGTAVDAAFKRTDGCEIARWEALVPLLPSASLS